MQPSKTLHATMLGIGVAAALGAASPSFAQGSTAPTTSNAGGSAAARDQLLDSTASLNENLVEFALAGKADKVAESLRDIEAAMPKLESSLGAAVYAAVASQLGAVKAAVARHDLDAAALSSIEIYRLLQEAIDQKTRAAPLDVALLDYSGFKLSALAAAPQPNWTTMNDAVVEEDRFWKRLEPSVHDASLQALVSHIGQGLADGVARKDSAEIAFAAEMLLDSVDLLEGQFTVK